MHFKFFLECCIN